MSSRVSLVPPAADATRVPWPLRATDVDLHGHVNNAAYWQAVEHRLASGRLELRSRCASMDYGEPVDLGDDVALAETLDGDGYRVVFLVGERVKACRRTLSRRADLEADGLGALAGPVRAPRRGFRRRPERRRPGRRLAAAARKTCPGRR